MAVFSMESFAQFIVGVLKASSKSSTQFLRRLLKLMVQLCYSFRLDKGSLLWQLSLYNIIKTHFGHNYKCLSNLPWRADLIYLQTRPETRPKNGYGVRSK